LLNVAICNCPNSQIAIEAKILQALGKDCDFTKLATIDDILNSHSKYDISFANICDMDIFMQQMKNTQQLTPGDMAKTSQFGFITFVNDITCVLDTQIDMMLDFLHFQASRSTIRMAIEFLTNKGVKSIALAKILFFEFYNRKIKIVTTDGEYICNDSLHNVLAMVGGHGFTQPHKSFIVNLAHITSIKNYSVFMNDGSIVPLSQKKSREFRLLYKVYVGEAVGR